jgi:hypothetical protein
MDFRLQLLRRLAAQGDVDAKTRLAFLELGMLGPRADVGMARSIADLIHGLAFQESIWWLGGSWKGHPAFISIDPPGERPGLGYFSDLFQAYFSMKSPLNVNNFTFFKIIGNPDTPPDRIITELSGHGSGAIYGVNLYPSPDPTRSYQLFEHQNEVQRYWFQHPNDLLDRMASRLDEMDENKKREQIARERWAAGEINEEEVEDGEEDEEENVTFDENEEDGYEEDEYPDEEDEN